MTDEVQFYYDWDITKLETTAKVGNYQNVVTKVIWTLIGKDDLGFEAPLYGETEIPVDKLTSGNPVTFIPYETLTPKEVEVMLEDALGEDEIARLTDNLKIQLLQLEETQTTLAPPPWLSKA